MADPNKTWTVVGTSVQRGEKTLRFANGAAADRYKVLDKAGCTEIRLFDLPSPMTKEQAVAWLEAQGETAIPVLPEAKERAPRAERAPKPVKPTLARAVPNYVPQPRERKFVTKILTPFAGKTYPYEDLGRAWHKEEGSLAFLPWEELAVETQQEYCRNAARRAGHVCPPGTFPELEKFLNMQGVTVNEDGTLNGWKGYPEQRHPPV